MPDPDDPELRRRLLEVEQSAPPDYPDYRRGLRFGLIAAALIAVPLLVIGVCIGRWDWPALWAVPLAYFLVAGAVGAFKQRDR